MPCKSITKHNTLGNIDLHRKRHRKTTESSLTPCHFKQCLTHTDYIDTCSCLTVELLWCWDERWSSSTTTISSSSSSSSPTEDPDDCQISCFAFSKKKSKYILFAENVENEPRKSFPYLSLPSAVNTVHRWSEHVEQTAAHSAGELLVPWWWWWFSWEDDEAKTSLHQSLKTVPSKKSCFVFFLCVWKHCAWKSVSRDRDWLTFYSLIQCHSCFIMLSLWFFSFIYGSFFTRQHCHV